MTITQEQEQVIREALAFSNLDHGTEPSKLAEALARYSTDQLFESIGTGGFSAARRSDIALDLAEQLKSKLGAQ